MEEIKLKDSYDTLVVGGGSIKGLIFLGALQCAVDRKLLTNVKNCIGVSVGCIICYLFSINYTPIEIITYICANKLIERMQSFDLVSVIHNQGAISYTPVQECLEKMTLAKVGKFLTMRELYEKYDKNLVCCTYNTTTKNTEYISHENYPDLPCLIALRMSSNVPLLFEKFKYMGNNYVDGAISDNFPIMIGEKIGTNVLGFYLASDVNNNQPPEHEENSGILEYIFKLLYVPIDQAVKYRCNLTTDKCTIVGIPNTRSSLFDFNIHPKIKLELFSDGYQFFNRLKLRSDSEQQDLNPRSESETQFKLKSEVAEVKSEVSKEVQPTK